MFARLAGQKSPSLLHHVMEGKRNLTPATIEQFAAAMKLSAVEAAFFTLLVELGQASTDKDRNAAWERIAATRRFRDARRIEGEGFAYLARWFYPAIRELAHRDDFVDDPAFVAAALRPRITVAKARRVAGSPTVRPASLQVPSWTKPISCRRATSASCALALEALMAMGLLVTDPTTGRTRPAEASVVTPHEEDDNGTVGPAERALPLGSAAWGPPMRGGATTTPIDTGSGDALFLEGCGCGHRSTPSPATAALILALVAVRRRGTRGRQS